LKRAAGAACAAAWPWESAGADATTLRAAGAGRHILVGSAVSNVQLHRAEIASILAEQCSIVVAENEMKWKRVHPEQDHYDFTMGDELVRFAEKNSISVRGHNLCWHNSMPDWLGKVATKENAAQLLESHILTVAGRYAGKIHSWDVVNEAIELGDGRRDGLRNSLWMQLLGERYLAMAFHAAQQADPKALLTYNDYGLEGDSEYHEKRRKVALALLKWFRTNKIPIHALGLQSHLKGTEKGTNYSGLRRFLDDVAALDLQIFVTELDVDDTELGGNAEKKAKEAAAIAKEYLETALKHPQVTAVLTWGMVSHGSKAKPKGEAGHRALPYDENLQPTAFLGAMVEALQKG
jgi:endo-1,4-beta-xylanase